MGASIESPLEPATREHCSLRVIRSIDSSGIAAVQWGGTKVPVRGFVSYSDLCLRSSLLQSQFFPCIPCSEGEWSGT